MVANATIVSGSICWGMSVGCTLAWHIAGAVGAATLAATVAGAAVFYAGVLVWDLTPAWQSGRLTPALARELVSISSGYLAPSMAQAILIGEVIGFGLVWLWLSQPL